jgi:hypothetical protein
MVVLQIAVPEALKARLNEERENFSMSSYVCNIIARHVEMIDDYRTMKYNL